MFLKTLFSVLSATTLLLALTATPIITQQITGFDLGNQAQAKGGNDGNGGGNGGGNSGGHGNSASAGHGNGHGFGHDDNSPGRSATAGNHGLGNGKGLGNNQKSVAASLGRLNAAHASATARAHASPNSAVGLIAQYEAAVYAAREASTEEEQAELEQAAMGFLGQAANKEINEAVVSAVNDLLGIAAEAEPESDSGPQAENQDSATADSATEA
ncbi:hypothetical protein KDX31_04995 [Amphritea atlantica]|uniref:Uncharacterized protein n=1 Tax=Amphritea atlantica TaxID=355243 RepID=A0ABY5GYR5_9GAMM|nr:hypothetical protein KDX31_04995 [Amphritea atlantica]